MAVGSVAACTFPEYVLESASLSPSPLNRICTDGQTSEAETGIDCGGGCSPCSESGPCKVARDCVTESCIAGVCQAASCDDGVKNGGETDRDCGGQCAAQCRVDDYCFAAADCASGICSAGVCRAPSCTDLAKNGDETGADCGGSCAACGLGSTCRISDDCVSERCLGGLCVSPQCTDGALSDDETGVDCGGPSCAPCPTGQACREPSDCVSMLCDASSRCVAAACDDLTLNGNESDLDCGGSCAGCSELQQCQTATDCASGACQSALCVPLAPTGTQLSRAGWTVSASSTHAYSTPADVLDGDPEKYWSNAALQEAGMYLEVDMGEVRTFFALSFQCPIETDAAGTFDLYFSSDGQIGEPARRDIAGFPSTSVEFATAQVARYVRIQLSAPKHEWWCIAELQVYR